MSLAALHPRCVLNELGLGLDIEQLLLKCFQFSNFFFKSVYWIFQFKRVQIAHWINTHNNFPQSLPHLPLCPLKKKKRKKKKINLSFFPRLTSRLELGPSPFFFLLYFFLLLISNKMPESARWAPLPPCRLFLHLQLHERMNCLVPGAPFAPRCNPLLPPPLYPHPSSCPLLSSVSSPLPASYLLLLINSRPPPTLPSRRRLFL